MSFASTQYLFSEHKWWGQWWLPDNIDNKKSGPLTYSPADFSQLQIGPGFPRGKRVPHGPGISMDAMQDGNWDVIHGVIENRSVTLLGCQIKREHSNLFSFTEGADEQLFTIQQIVVGKFISSDREDAFTTLYTSFEDLTPWFGASGVQLETKVDPEERAREGTILRILPAKTRICATEFGTVTLTAGANEPYPVRLKGGVQFTSTLSTSIRVDFTGPVDLQKSRSTVKLFQEFIALATNSDPGILSARAYDETQEQSTGFPLFFRTRGTADPDAKRDHGSTFLFDFSDINFEVAVSTWVRLRKEVGSVFNVLFGFRYNGSHFLESQVTALVSAAEALSKKYQLVDKNHEVIPNRKDLKKITLADRLWGLVMELPENIRQLITSNPTFFVREAKDARNGISHSGEADVGPEMLYGVAKVTESVLVCWTVLKLGVDPDKLADSLLSNRRASHSIQVAKETFPT
ncbi:ApeA N-terminal domain 1-containing protein [Corynebacterium sp. A21]|uniref:ApeA N-terminal domain 1-containing protein n=1 Tax=Corynebacterium sp. A21 TaxID=3457318 RepID=UPI003FD05225